MKYRALLVDRCNFAAEKAKQILTNQEKDIREWALGRPNSTDPEAARGILHTAGDGAYVAVYEVKEVLVFKIEKPPAPPATEGKEPNHGQ